MEEETMLCEERLQYIDHNNNNNEPYSLPLIDRSVDLRVRLVNLLISERAYAPNPRYMREIQAGRLRVSWRSKVAEWLMAVS